MNKKKFIWVVPFMLLFLIVEQLNAGANQEFFGSMLYAIPIDEGFTAIYVERISGFEYPEKVKLYFKNQDENVPEEEMYFAVEIPFSAEYTEMDAAEYLAEDLEHKNPVGVSAEMNVFWDGEIIVTVAPGDEEYFRLMRKFEMYRTPKYRFFDIFHLLAPS